MTSAPASPPQLRDPTSAIIDVVARLDPRVDHAQLAALIARVVPQQARRHVLADQLDARGDLLTGAGAHGSPAVIKLIEQLLARGVSGVVAPPCPFCDRPARLTRCRDGLRCCKTCWGQAHAKTCARCGRAGVNERRTSAGTSLCAACCRSEPSLQERCSGCGRMALAIRRDGDLVFCQACCQPPVAVCSACGLRKPCRYADTDAPRCKNCADLLRAQPCSGCGRARVVSRRTKAGQPLCRECARPKDLCAGCQRVRPVRARAETGTLCQTCYKRDTSSHRTCVRCGAVERLHRHGLCAACAWPDVLRRLLTPPGGTLRPALEPVLAALSAADPRTGLNWVARSETQQVLSALADPPGPITHALLDQMAPAEAAERLRTVLVDLGALPARDERLFSLERSISRRIARVDDPDDRKILHSFATWHHLRRLRAVADRRPITHDQVLYACNSLTAAANLLNWLRGRGQRLATCGQADIDEWLTFDPFSRTRGFVTWAVRGGHARGIDISRYDNEPTREVFGDHERRWALARRLLDDDTVALPDRVAGLFVLLYAQRATDITQLTTKQVTSTDDGVKLLLGREPITVPPAFGGLLRELIAERPDDTAAAPGNYAWLFPGPRRGQALSPKVLLRRLAAIGVPARIGRNSALMELAGEVPATVISGLLGISIDRATRWTQDASTTRPGYAAEVARRDEPRKF